MGRARTGIRSLVRASAFALTALSAYVIAGCSGPGIRHAEPFLTHLETRGELGQCARFFRDLDDAVQRAAVADAETARIPGFPYLRVNRFLASGLAPDPKSPTFDVWVVRLQTLDQEGRAKELANLPKQARDGISELSRSSSNAVDEIGSCGDRLRRNDLADGDQRKRLVEAARVPPSYSLTKRTFGLYPVTSVIFLAGVKRLHERIVKDFEGPLDELQVAGKLVRFRPHTQGHRPTFQEVAKILEESSRNPLGIPEPTGRARERLFEAYAPIWEVDVTGDHDRLGTPVWNKTPHPSLDITQPAVFRRLSHVRFQGKTLLQLSYVIWFPERPRTGRFDLLGGRLDGIIWRVTLDLDGRPLIYDAVHNCGCYHMFFPTERLVHSARSQGHEEPILVAQNVPADRRPIVLRVATGTHYIQRVHFADNGQHDTPYAWRDYHELRSLPVDAENRRSLFRADGIVPGTERGERWLFWPMGITEPGAMRQWGNHATAFVGRRHFDDPGLMERYFEATASDVVETSPRP